MNESSPKQGFATARSLLAQVKQDAARARGSVWGYLLMVFLLLMIAAVVVSTVSHSVISGSPEQVEHMKDSVWQLFGLLATPLVAGASWVCVQQLRGGSQGAWTSFKHSCSRYGSLLAYKIVTASFLWVCSLIVLALSRLFAIGSGLSAMGAHLIFMLKLLTILALVVCSVFWSYVYPHILETNASALEAMQRSWRCVREAGQFWLIVRATLLLMLCVTAALILSMALPFWLASLGHAAFFFKLLGVALTALVLVIAYPFMIMLPVTLYCRFFTAQGERVQH